VLAPLSLVFGGQTLNTASPPQSVTLTNSGDASLTLISGQVTGDFTLNSGCGSSLHGHSSCVMNVTYLPTQVGPQSGTLVVSDANGSQTVSLRGNGLSSASLSAAPTSLNFGNQVLGTTSSPQAVIFSNMTTIAMENVSISLTGDFSIVANTCSTLLAGGGNCSLQIVFSPSVAGSRSGAISVSSSTLPSALAVPLNGTGQLSVTDTISTQSLTFAGQALNTASAAQAVMLTNSGEGSLTNISTQITGDFALITDCGSSLAAHRSCFLNVTYTPAQTGTETGTLTISDALRTQSVLLSGSGLAPAAGMLAPTSLVFAGQALNVASTSQNVTLTNTGDIALTGISAQVAGDFVLKNGCNKTLAPLASCDMSVTYKPTIAGPETGTLTVADSLRSQTIALSGAGMDFQMQATTSGAVTVSSGQSASAGFQIVPVANFSGTVSLACTGAPQNAICTLDASSVLLTGNPSPIVTAKVTTGIATTVGRIDSPGSMVAGLVLFAGALPIGLARLRRSRKCLCWLCLLIVTLVFSGCGAGASGASGGSGGGTTTPPPTGNSNVTPPGTYTITVAGTSQGVTRTAAFTLIVQ
jgi:hypothetical protein